jgi:hypothetical protein
MTPQKKKRREEDKGVESCMIKKKDCFPFQGMYSMEDEEKIALRKQSLFSKKEKKGIEQKPIYLNKQAVDSLKSLRDTLYVRVTWPW